MTPSSYLTRRRIVRWALILIAATLVFLACLQDPVYATTSQAGRVTVTLHTDGHGGVWLDTAHADGTPVTGAIDATLTARERAGDTVQPVPLTDLRDGSARYAGTLDRGVWTVTVDFSAPGPGTCTAVLTAADSAGAESVACADAIAAAVIRPFHLADTDPPAAGHASVTAVLMGAGLVAVLFTAVTLATIRRRASPVNDPPADTSYYRTG